MFETIINLKPKEEWRPGVTLESLTAEMDKALQFPGVSNAWTMPIKARIDMLSTGIRTPVGVKVIGTDLAEIDRLAKQIEQVLRAVPGTSAPMPSACIGGYYLDIVPDRDGAGALRPHDPGRAGRDRHRARRPDRDHHGGGPRALSASTCAIRATCAIDPQAIASDVLVPMPGGGAVPLGEVASVDAVARADLDPHRERPARGLHLSSTSATAISAAMSLTRKRAVQASVAVPARRLSSMWSGQFEYLERADGAAEDRGAGDAARSSSCCSTSTSAASPKR